MKIVVTVDVEEQGLFSGKYARHPEVDNVLHLNRLERITSRLGIPLTLLCTYPVVTDPACKEVLRRLQDEKGAELGVHLHPWNTPPFDDEGPNFLDSASMPTATLAAKLDNLVRAVRAMSGRQPTSFRMGRFDFSDAVRDLLLPAGLTVDSSAIPLQPTPAGDAYFLAPTDPYMLETVAGPILEAPPTMAGVISGTARAFRGLADILPESMCTPVLKYFKDCLRSGIHPMAYGVKRMKLAARLHQNRGGEVLTMFLHSSELSPGHSPKLPDQEAVDALLKRISKFLNWAVEKHDAKGTTLGALPTFTAG